MKITFIPGTQEINDKVPCPEPAKNFIPNWYKDIKPDKDLANVKKCIPFLDSISNGYIQKTWSDINITNEENILRFVCDSDVPLFSYREISHMPMDDSFHKLEFIWQRPWSTILPNGYSGLVVHPLNRNDLPFITLSGIVDFDKSIHAKIGNIPFYIKKDFTGTIPSGTPMFQIIPIKREEWVSDSEEYSDVFWKTKIKERLGVVDFYKKKVWQKKSFE